VDVTEGVRYDSAVPSYVDFDEIVPLLEGLDAIAQGDPLSSDFSDFEAHYRTRGGMRITTFSSGGSVKPGISSGAFGRVTAFFDQSSLEEFVELLRLAREKLSTTSDSRGT